MSILPANDKERKNLPIFKLISGYFPKALREVTRVAVANNVRYNPDRKPADINWNRGKSTDQLGSLFRHILEAEHGLVFEDLPPEVQAACGPGFERVYVLAEAAWRALAALELEIEKQEAVPTGTVARQPSTKLCLTLNAADGTRLSPPVLGCQCQNCNEVRRIAATGV
jgi:dATP/dGTP diphosphohydrolase